ncbi:MAG TPA: hypothetical protein PL048_16540 [Leptospiraceae bacterium]|nr:hypothetical protein [Leptospiraceae bacterium]HMY65385.1 hypothetical protein [Leptospiraceae bacterium]HMZ60388.1 hypothetical protein [Leptospiraceae bacterium]HNF13439.1 hypothetical protein [Leptospiraceae bacterium]HNF26864.1 hypothetical protein [Leptospiraceae bacterium]
MKKSIIKLFILSFIVSLTSALSANPFKGNWINNPLFSHSGYGKMAIIDDNTIDVGFWGPGGDRMEASYKLQAEVQGTMLAYTITKAQYMEENGKEGVCRIVKLKDNPYFQEELSCTGIIGSYLNSEHKGFHTPKVFRNFLPKDTPRKIQGNDTLSILKEGTVNDTAYLRSAPNVSAKPLNCVIWKADDSGRKEHDGQVIPKDRKLLVIAKTKTKFKVQKWENHWYYVDAGDGLSKCGPGWVFGEFVTIK